MAARMNEGSFDLKKGFVGDVVGRPYLCLVFFHDVVLGR
jgi:hypothetical protein